MDDAEIHPQPKAKGHLHDIWQAETKAEAEAAFDFFVESYGVKYDKAAAKLIKDREVQPNLPVRRSFPQIV